MCHSTTQKVAGLISDWIYTLFIDLILSVALWPGLTQSLREISSRDFSWGGGGGGKDGWYRGLTILSPSCVDCQKILKV
jgi:hypothetical protein